jgi:hypothetical protein
MNNSLVQDGSDLIQSSARGSRWVSAIETPTSHVLRESPKNSRKTKPSLTQWRKQQQQKKPDAHQTHFIVHMCAMFTQQVHFFEVLRHHFPIRVHVNQGMNGIHEIQVGCFL